MRRHKITKSPKLWVIEKECNVSGERFEIDDFELELYRARGCLMAIFKVLLFMGGCMVLSLLESLMSDVPSYVLEDELLFIGIALALLIGICIVIRCFLGSKLFLEVHIICCIHSDAKQLAYIAIETSTNELMVIQKLTGTNQCVIKKINVDEFKQIVRGTRYFEKLEDITQKTQGQLKNVQFGEFKYRNIWFVKSNEGNTIKLYGVWITFDNNWSVRYILCPSELYKEKYGNIDQLKELCNMFVHGKINFVDSTEVKYFFKRLTNSEIKLFSEKTKCNNQKCNGDRSFEGCYTKFIFDKEFDSNDVSVNHVNIMTFVEQLAGEELCNKRDIRSIG